VSDILHPLFFISGEQIFLDQKAKKSVDLKILWELLLTGVIWDLRSCPLQDLISHGHQSFEILLIQIPGR
jgi:hypothetical protein